MSDYTPEPWEAQDAPGDCIPLVLSKAGNGCLVAECNPSYTNAVEAMANAERIVACVNACAGMNPEAVPHLRAAAKMAADLYDQLALGPLEAAAKYGPDYEPPTDEDCLAVRNALHMATEWAKRKEGGS